MISYHTTSAALGLLLAISILLLVRSDHLHSRHAVWWLVVAVASLVFGFFPHVIDWLGAALGVAYPPVLALVGGIAVLLVKVLLQDLENTRQERQIRRLAQRLAIYEEEARPKGESNSLPAGKGNPMIVKIRDALNKANSKRR